jgi:hypothetical protein
MGFVGRGKVERGGLVFADPLPLPEGSDVIVHIEPAPAITPGSGEELAALPFFGMAADRDDMADSESWVRRNRESWHQRASRQD